MRCLISASLAVNDVARIRSARHEALLLRLDEHQVPAVVLQIGRVLGLEPAGKVDIGLQLGGGFRQHGHARRQAGQRLVGGAMQHDGGARPRLRHGAFGVGGLAVLQHAAQGEGRRLQIAHRVAGLAPGLAHRLDFLDAVFHLADEVDPSRLELGRERTRARSEGREVERDRILGIEERQLGIEEADLALLSLHLEVDRLAAQQAVDLRDVGLHVLDLDRAESHGAPGGEAGADAEVDAAGRQRVERGQRIGGDRRDAIGRHQHAGAEADAARVDRRRAHGDEAIGTQHLGVVEPGMREAQFLGALRQLPGIRRRRQGDAEIHGLLSVQVSARAASMRSRAAKSPSA